MIRKKTTRHAGDNEPPIFRFLPELGKATPGRRVGGVVRSHETHPNDYLSARIGRAIVGSEDGVPYAIPDVMATESRMVQLIRDHREEASRHPQMIQWRGALATLLLWRTWEIGENRLKPPQCRTYAAKPEMPFAHSILKTVNRADWPYIKVLYLERLSDNGKKYEFPLAFVSRRTIIVPAENPVVWLDDYPEGLKHMLPEEVTWYDPVRRCFLDPCDTLNEVDRIRLGRLLLLLTHGPGAGPKKLSFDQVNGALERFIDDLNRKHTDWFNTLTRPSRADGGRQVAEWQKTEWRVRAAFSGIRGVTEEPFSLLEPKHISENFLLSALMEDAGGEELDQREESEVLEAGQAHSGYRPREVWADKIDAWRTERGEFEKSGADEGEARLGGHPEEARTDETGTWKNGGGGFEKSEMEEGEMVQKILYCYEGVPFAVEDQQFLVRPYNWDETSEAASQALLRLQQAVSGIGENESVRFTYTLRRKLEQPTLHSKFIQKAREWLAF